MDPSSIEIRPLVTPRELAACVSLQYETWGEGFTDVVPPSILTVVGRIGGVAAGAFDPSDRLLGFVFGMTGVERGQIVHWSDMLAVRPEARGLGLGLRLKAWQRDSAREAGASVIYWTFDPLVARNAHLNFNRLGVRVAQYVENMYGVTESVLHGLMPTDRLIVAWPTRDADAAHLLAEAERVRQSVDGEEAPLVTSDWIQGAAGASILPHYLRVEIPFDVETLLIEAPDEAAVWRERVRCAMQWALSTGYAVSALSLAKEEARAFYLLTRTARAASPAGGGR